MRTGHAPGQFPPGSADALHGIRLLRDARISPGSRWIYSAGFNVGADLADTRRIDTELADLRRLSDAGARVALLSHQGSQRDATAVPLDHVARYLTHRLARPVRYVPTSADARARRVAGNLRPGEIALFGNTRLAPGEEDGDLLLAERFAALGEKAAIGGFSKAHRAHSSNCGLLRHVPGYAADSLVREIRLLAPWAQPEAAGPRVAVIGGGKPEKVQVGLLRLAQAYDLLVPGGVVLNTLLLAMGHRVGCSDLGADRERSLRAACAVLSMRRKAVIHVPATVLVRRRAADGTEFTDGTDDGAFPVEVARGVPGDCAIVDFILEPWAAGMLGGAARALVAGPPSLCREGHTVASRAVLAALRPIVGSTLLLGGDTAREMPWNGPSSTGGGSALQYIADSTCTVLEHLRDNAMAAKGWAEG